MRITERAQRIEPFYVMEVAKAARSLGDTLSKEEQAMLYLNVGEPDFTAPPLVQAAAKAAIDAGKPCTPKPAASLNCANTSASGTAHAFA